MMNSKDIEKRLFIEDSIELQINSKNNNNTNVLKDRDFMGVPQEKLQPPTGKIEALADDLGDTFLEKKGKKYTLLDDLKGLAPIYAIDRHRLSTDGQGVTTLVVFHGCPLRCEYCINRTALNLKDVQKILSPEDLYIEIKQDNLYFLASGGGITFGGGEPCLYSGFITNFKNLCNPKWKLNIETSLCIEHRFVKKLLSVVDFWIIDIKDMDNDRYKQYTGSNNNLMIKNLKFLLNNGKANQMLVRVPFIKGFNTIDDVKNNVAILKGMGVLNIDVFDYKTSPNEEENKVLPLRGSPQHTGPYEYDRSLPF